MRDSDLLPTLMSAAGFGSGASEPAGAVANGLAGLDLWPVLQGAPVRERETFFFAVEGRGTGWRAAIDGSSKLVTLERMEAPGLRRAQLYDLARDPGERHDLAASEPERVAELERRLAAWEARYPADGLRYSEAPPGWSPPADLNPLAAPGAR